MMEPSDAAETEAAAVPTPSSVGHELSPLLLPSSTLPPSMLDSDRSGNTKPSPIETRRLEARGPGASPSSLARDKGFRDRGADRLRGTPNSTRPTTATVATASRTGSGDDYQSLCGSVSTLNTALSSPPSTPNTVATSYFVDEPPFYEGSDVAPSRTASLPVKGVHGRGRPPSRSDSIDSESSVTFAAVPVSQQPPTRMVRRMLKHSTFPIHMRPPPVAQPVSPRHMAFDHHQLQQYQQQQYYTPSSLRSASFPAPSSPVLERDSGLGDETDETDDTEAIERTESTGDTMDAFTPQDSVFNDDADKDASLPDSVYSDPVLNEARPNEGLIEDLCNYTLKKAFNTELPDIHGRSEAWRTVARCWHELSKVVEAEENHISSACDGSEAQSCGASSASGSAGGHSGNGNGGSRKRANHYGRDNDGSSGDGFNADGSGGDDDGRSGDGAGMSSKKLKTAEVDQKFSCPYRKRNPLRFNVRDHPTCANQPYSSMANLKRHVKTFHKHIPKGGPQTVCPRCKEAVPNLEALEDHLMQSTDRMCVPREGLRVPRLNSHIDPEDGINNHVESILNGRKNNHKVDNWDSLWRTLFPGDTTDEIKDPTFVPPIELDEVQWEFHHGPVQLFDRLFPAFQDDPRIDHDTGLSLTQTIDDICQSYIRETLNRCRQNLENLGSSTSSRRRRPPTARNAPRSPAPARHPSFGQETPLNLQIRGRLPLLIPSTAAATMAGTSTSSNDNSHHQALLMDPIAATTQAAYVDPVSTHEDHITSLSAFAQDHILTSGMEQSEPLFAPGPSSNPFSQIPRNPGEVEPDLESGILDSFGAFPGGYTFGFPHQERVTSMAMLQAGLGARGGNNSPGGSPGWEGLDGSDITASHTGFHHVEGTG